MPAAHSAADRLIEITLGDGSSQLLTPPETVTFPTSHGGTTIDLAFATEELANRALECRTAPELDFSSDHQPILLRFQARVARAQLKPSRCWKLAKIDEAILLARGLDTSRVISTADEAESYARYLSGFLQAILNATVPLKRASAFANPWWNSRVARAVANARTAQRTWLRTRSPEDKQEASRLGMIRSREIVETKRASFRQFVDEAAQGDGLWKPARWSKGAGPALAQVPNLHTDQKRAEDHPSKVEMLKEHFFPITPADLSDLERQVNRSLFEIEQTTSAEEISTVLRSCPTLSAPGEEEIPFHFLKCLGEPVAQAIANLANACLRLEVFPPFLKKARMIVLKKPGKNSYESPNSWQPIALLKTIGKVIEKLVAKRIREAAEARQLIPPNQIGARAKHSTSTALELLTSMVHTVWKEGRSQVATLLSLDISGAFPTVVHKRLVAIIR
jgi:hypothetical protein